jgi:hypothetical protein
MEALLNGAPMRIRTSDIRIRQLIVAGGNLSETQFEQIRSGT